MALLTQEIAELDSGGSKVGGGTYTFQDLTGTVVLQSTVLESFSRRGVDGAGVRVIASHPRPFTLTSTSYEDSFSDAKTAIANYKGLKGKAYGVKLTKDSIDYLTFDVLEVEESQPPRSVLVKLSGQSNNSAKIRHVCTWTLLDRPEP